MREPVSVCKHRGILLAHQNLPTVLLPSTLLPVCRFGTQTLADESGGQRRAETLNGWTSSSAKAYTADGLRVVRASERGLQRSGGVIVVAVAVLRGHKLLPPRKVGVVSAASRNMTSL